MTAIDSLTRYQFGWLTALSCALLMAACAWTLWKGQGND